MGEGEGRDKSLRDYLLRDEIDHDVLDSRRVVIYADDVVGETLRSRFCTEKCTFRAPTLEDVFAIGLCYLIVFTLAFLWFALKAMRRRLVK